MDKPRIRRNPAHRALIEAGYVFGSWGFRFECRGSGVSGYGFDPGGAFDDWIEKVKFSAGQPERDRLRAAEQAKETAERRKKLAQLSGIAPPGTWVQAGLPTNPRKGFFSWLGYH